MCCTLKLANKSRLAVQQCKKCKIIKPRPKFKSLNTAAMLKNCQAYQKARAAILPPLTANVRRVRKPTQKVVKDIKIR